MSVYSQEARTVFSSLALLAPTSVLPRLLFTLATAAENPTQPHRFHVCIQAVAAVAGPLVAHFPGRAVELLHSLLPAIDVNDIWRSTDIFVCMGNLLERLPVTSDTKLLEAGDVEVRHNLEDFVAEFMNKCFNLIENSQREKFGEDCGVDNGEDDLNEEEEAVDTAVNDTFLRMYV